MFLEKRSITGNKTSKLATIEINEVPILELKTTNEENDVAAVR